MMLTNVIPVLLSLIEGPPPYAGPIRCWQDAIDALTSADATKWLLWVKRTRRSMLQVNDQGRSWPVKRAELRDYLRQRNLPRWMRARPVPEGTGPTICFRRPVPFSHRSPTEPQNARP